MKGNDFGFVYMVKFKYFDNCYKIGSTKDPVCRVNTLSRLYGPTEMVVCGECNHKRKIEKMIHWALYRHSNSCRIRTGNYTKDNFVGPASSPEHFHLDHIAIYDALVLINENCDSLNGKDFRLIRSHPRFGIEYDAYQNRIEIQ